jgi:alpha/beta hydrolase family protein
VFLGLHRNPTWSFLYRHIVNGLKDRFRCVALDYPGFGPSTRPAGYRYTVAEHSRVVEGFVTQLGNTFGWPVRGEKCFERFSKADGEPVPGRCPESRTGFLAWPTSPR